MNNKTTGRVLPLITAVLLLALDLWTKQLAVTFLKNKAPIPLIPEILELQYLENHGAAFGILQNQKIFLVIFTGILLMVILFYYFKAPMEKKFTPFRFLAAAIVAGAIGNMLDRCRLDYVVDFIYFKPIDFPIFNVADIYVTCSVAIFAILILVYYKEEDLDFLFHPFKKQ